MRLSYDQAMIVNDCYKINLLGKFCVLRERIVANSSHHTATFLTAILGNVSLLGPTIMLEKAAALGGEKWGLVGELEDDCLLHHPQVPLAAVERTRLPDIKM